ncbi:hypothetical protein B9Z55_016132 [Caenorhabditis nigoni]|uniref:Uncharacterized protein n=1 Tax=Caenorhabditis nigoni TaxID=1611254 RepID=A0A2G5UDE8_9PELO|nr:hypothetical protein B9Z55_016132 [Caenorhabditis nigoni]
MTQKLVNFDAHCCKKLSLFVPSLACQTAQSTEIETPILTSNTNQNTEQCPSEAIPDPRPTNVETPILTRSSGAVLMTFATPTTTPETAQPPSTRVPPNSSRTETSAESASTPMNQNAMPTVPIGAKVWLCTVCESILGGENLVGLATRKAHLRSMHAITSYSSCRCHKWTFESVLKKDFHVSCFTNQMENTEYAPIVYLKHVGFEAGSANRAEKRRLLHRDHPIKLAEQCGFACFATHFLEENTKLVSLPAKPTSDSSTI